MHPDTLVGVRPEVSPPRKGWEQIARKRAHLSRRIFPRASLLSFKFQISNLKFIPKLTFEVTYPSGTILTAARQLWKPRIRNSESAHAMRQQLVIRPHALNSELPLDFSGAPLFAVFAKGECFSVSSFSVFSLKRQRLSSRLH
jgi:hypothetical protein